MSPSTIKEHLERLSAAGLIAQEEGDTKWKYYRLTDKGKSIIKPYETRVWIMLAVSLMFLGASVYSLVGVVPQPDFVPMVSAPETSLLKAADYGGAREIPAAEPPALPAQDKTKLYAYLSLTLFFAIASGVMAARAMRI
jgi:DNA-binding transcriptional ArsR family regulator